MKQLILKFGLLLFITSITLSCSSDDDSGPAEAPQTKFRALVSGENLNTDNVSGVLSNNGGRLSITATTSIGTITLTVGSNTLDAPEITEQTYTVNEMNDALLSLGSGGVSYLSNATLGGEIVISSINTTEMTLFGSFSGQIVNTTDPDDIITISSGSLFNVNFIEQ